MPALSRRAFLSGCAAAGLSLALIRPARAESVSPPPDVHDLGNGIWLCRGDSQDQPNGLVLIGLEDVLLVDIAGPRAGDLLAWLAQAAPNRPVNLVVTAADAGRAGGLGAVQVGGGWSMARDGTVKAAEALGFGAVQRSWSGESAGIVAGRRPVELFYPGPAFTRDNTVVFLPQDGLLFGGGVVQASANLGAVAESDLCRWPQSIEAVIARYGKAAKTVVPGQGEAGDADLLAHTRQLTRAEAAKSCHPAG